MRAKRGTPAKRRATRRTTRRTRRRLHAAPHAHPKKKSRPARRRATPGTDRHLDFIDAAARVLDLAIEPSWKPAIEANLEATLQLAASFMEFPLADEAEPAPIFTA